MTAVPTDAHLVRAGDAIRREPDGVLWLVVARHRAGDTILLTLVCGQEVENVPYQVGVDQVLVEQPPRT